MNFTKRIKEVAASKECKDDDDDDGDDGAKNCNINLKAVTTLCALCYLK